MKITKEVLNHFLEGTLYNAYDYFGAHKSYKGTLFQVYAPNAYEIELIGSFNNWGEHKIYMNKIFEEGIWQVELDKDFEYYSYKYKITANNQTFEKADPYAFYSELRPNNASIVYDLNYHWNDVDFIHNRSNVLNQPVNIYEMHLGTWQKNNENFFTYEEIASKIIPYLLEQNYTHVEFMPITEHPFDGSWGYQVSGFYAATSRYGDPKKLKYLIDQLHQNNIAVILDWVPVHFVKDSFGLIDFDGSSLYEYPFDDLKETELWGTRNFDFGKKTIHSFLISNALFWLKEFHADGLRVDAVSNIIHFHGNKSRGENNNGIDFLKHLNVITHQYVPHILMIAEDSSDYQNVSAPVFMDGLGFDFKWNMGWMNDTLKYIQTDFEERYDIHHNITFMLAYAHAEHYILPLSHDEVVHLKKSIINKMPGSYEEKFSGLKVLYGLMYTLPGKKLNFMGNEFAMFDEWNEYKAIHFNLFEYEAHQKFNAYMREIAYLYKTIPALFHDQPFNFNWLDVDNKQDKIYIFQRELNDKYIFIANFNNVFYKEYPIYLENGTYETIIDSNYEKYFGTSNQVRQNIQTINENNLLLIDVNPLSFIILKKKA